MEVMFCEERRGKREEGSENGPAGRYHEREAIILFALPSSRFPLP
jgi:hypothetical protein